jgi:hypothetical protein
VYEYVKPLFVRWGIKLPHINLINTKMKTEFKTVDELIENDGKCPLPLSIIPNYMGINLCSVDAISWQKQSDGQLVNLTIHFIPSEKEG